MEIPLSLKNKKNGLLVYRITPFFTISSLVIFIIIFTSSTLFESISIVGIICSFIVLLGALYTEHWIFDSTKKTVTYRTGVYPLLKKETWKSSTISRVTISPFIKGEIDQTKAYALIDKLDSRISKPSFLPFAPELRIRLRLILEFTDGETVLVDEAGIRSRNRLISVGQRIAQLTHTSFVK